MKPHEVALLFRILKIIVLAFTSPEYVKDHDASLVAEIDATIKARHAEIGRFPHE